MRRFLRRGIGGITLTEIMVGVAILGLAMTPIIGMIVKTFSQIRNEKSEAIAANYAGKLLTGIVFEMKYDDVVARNDSADFKFNSTTNIDGCDLKWSIEIAEVNGLTFKYMKPEYHGPHTGGEVAGIKFEQLGGSTVWNRTAAEIDRKFLGKSVMCDVKLTIQWKSPGEAYDNERKQVLYTRKARIE